MYQIQKYLLNKHQTLTPKPWVPEASLTYCHLPNLISQEAETEIRIIDEFFITLAK